jgi:3-oxoacyl-[acyl-carrier protein] reductase
MSSLEGKVALVTGSSHGNGAGIATHFAQQGARVVVHGRDAAAVSDVAGRIGQAGGRAMQVTADVTRYAEIEAMRLRIEQELGPVDVLVANAGGNPVRPALRRRSARRAGARPWTPTSRPRS